MMGVSTNYYIPQPARIQSSPWPAAKAAARSINKLQETAPEHNIVLLCRASAVVAAIILALVIELLRGLYITIDIIDGSIVSMISGVPRVMNSPGTGYTAFRYCRWRAS